MKRVTILLVLLVLGSVAFAGNVFAARALTESEIQQLINARAQEILDVSTARAQARVTPMLVELSDSLTMKIAGVSSRLDKFGEEIDLLNQQLGVIQAGITSVEGSIQGTSGEIANLRLVNEEFQRQLDAEMTKKLDLQTQKNQEAMAGMQKQLDDMKARLEKRTIFSHARTILEIGMAGLLIYHVLDHDGR